MSEFFHTLAAPSVFSTNRNANCHHDVVLSQHAVRTTPTDAKNARMVRFASNAVIVSRLICEKQGAAGAAILDMKLILMNRIEVFLLPMALYDDDARVSGN